MNENYYALILCIVTDLFPEIALKKFGILTDEDSNKKRSRGITFNDIREMFRLKDEGYSYTQIGNLYNKTGDAIYKKMKRSSYLIHK